MIVQEENSDIFEEFARREKCLLLHCCNCFNTMGAGIAQKIRKAFPQAAQADAATKRGDWNKLGTYSLAKISEDKYVVNVYAQYYYGRDKRHLDYDSLRHALEVLTKEFDSSFDILTYRFGCKLAGGDWSVTRKIFDESTPRHRVSIFDKSDTRKTPILPL